MTQHWLKTQKRQVGHQHINRIRISAENMLKLMTLRNKLTGENKSMLEQSNAIEEKQREQQW